ncbi:hypothetical protein EW146_g3096 [Bondarzewia mesenterica]|uniref:Uncharacterized protein n=1 Tax=Bondarzewia mesenterica TaxID=1095465 RepID=A0A4S4LYM8_9AGAM|nr:hypothetical protein EW146_g3096 [Bondarzewia mesenterica]
MSRAAKATLLASLFVTTFTVWAVHYQQEQEHEVTGFVSSALHLDIFFMSQTMYKGVLRDDERRREKMKKRQEELDESQRKRAIYERLQRVGAGEASSGSDVTA